jgi:hypothetical protein
LSRVRRFYEISFWERNICFGELVGVIEIGNRQYEDGERKFIENKLKIIKKWVYNGRLIKKEIWIGINENLRLLWRIKIFTAAKLIKINLKSN